MNLIAFDLDGTLFDVREGTDYESRDSVRAGARPHVESVRRVCDLFDRGYRVAYVTGRCEHLRGLTVVQTRVQAGLPPGQLRMQPFWMGYDVMASWKAAQLVELGAVMYVGDHEADRTAARTAGIPFVHVDEFRAGSVGPLEGEQSLCEHGRPYYNRRTGLEVACGDCGRG